MQAYKLQTVIPANHRLNLVLPPELPEGAAEIIILTGATTARPSGRERIAALRAWLQSLPAAPDVPLSAFDRGELYVSRVITLNTADFAGFPVTAVNPGAEQTP